MPGDYNVVRADEQPIPQADRSIDELNYDGDEDEDLQTTFYDSGADVKPVFVFQDIAAIDDCFNFDEGNQPDPLDIENDQAANFDRPSNFSSEVEHESTRNDEDLVQNDEIHDAHLNVATETMPNQDTREKEIEQNVQKLIRYGKRVFCDDEVEYISIPGQKLEAIKDEPTYQVKVDDLLSGKKAFKHYVTYFHVYLFSKR